MQKQNNQIQAIKAVVAIAETRLFSKTEGTSRASQHIRVMLEDIDQQPVPTPVTLALWAGYLYGFFVWAGYVTIDEINLTQLKYKGPQL